MERMKELIDKVNYVTRIGLEVYDVDAFGETIYGKFNFMGVDGQISVPNRDSDLTFYDYLMKNGNAIGIGKKIDSARYHMLELIILNVITETTMVFDWENRMVWEESGGVWRFDENCLVYSVTIDDVSEYLKEEISKFKDLEYVGPATIVMGEDHERVKVSHRDKTVYLPMHTRSNYHLYFYEIDYKDSLVDIHFLKPSGMRNNRYHYFLNKAGYVKCRVEDIEQNDISQAIQSLFGRPGYWDSPVNTAAEKAILDQIPHKGPANQYTGENVIVSPNGDFYYIRIGGIWVSVTQDYIFYSDLPQEIADEVEISKILIV